MTITKRIIQQKRSSIILLLFVLLGLTSCDSELIYEENQAFENNTWSYDDPKEFSFELEDSLTPVKIYINLRTTIDYQFSNIYMYLHLDFPGGYSDVDPLEFFLAQADGKWLGETSGTVVENRAMITQGYLMYPGKYTFKLEQAMYDNDLTEVLDVGIRVENLVLEE